MGDSLLNAATHAIHPRCNAESRLIAAVVVVREAE
jgi:hypothetical protein